MKRGLEGSVAFVTGGASGIGRATVLALADAGASVSVADRNGASAAEPAETVGGKAFAIQCDVADEESVTRAVARTETALGPIDVLANLAGIMTPNVAPIHRMSVLDFDDMVAIHVRGSFLCCRAVLPEMIDATYFEASTAYLRDP